jgi:hypothetical protein
MKVYMKLSLVSSNTVQQTTICAKKSYFLEWGVFEPRVMEPIPEHKILEPKAKPNARDNEVEAFEAY